MTPLNSVAQQFILHWGEMSSRWGINRTMAQIHALLYVSPEPLNAEQIGGRLQVARSNVSTSLRELQAWGIVRVVHLLGDRRDYFETVQDAFKMFQVILEQRKRREIDPTIAMLRGCLEHASLSKREEDEYPLQRMEELLQLLQTLTLWYEQVGKLPLKTQKKVLRMGSRIQKLTG
ncbi:MAG: GbsR/MarR family transcriptional regulator [Planctomycetota bacterium]|jgi:DNA-binding transcriptional regulator GbsR (MarR family)